MILFYIFKNICLKVIFIYVCVWVLYHCFLSSKQYPALDHTWLWFWLWRSCGLMQDQGWGTGNCMNAFMCVYECCIIVSCPPNSILHWITPDYNFDSGGVVVLCRIKVRGQVTVWMHFCDRICGFYLCSLVGLWGLWVLFIIYVVLLVHEGYECCMNAGLWVLYE